MRGKHDTYERIKDAEMVGREPSRVGRTIGGISGYCPDSCEAKPVRVSESDRYAWYRQVVWGETVGDGGAGSVRELQCAEVVNLSDVRLERR